MADSNLLASIIAGQDPLSPQMLQGQQGAQLSAAAIDPNFAHNSGPFGVLASLIAGTRGHDMLQNSVQNTTQARMGAAPDLARLLAQPDPYQAAAANPGGYNPIALGTVVNGANPLQAAQSREAAARAVFLGAQANLANRAGQPGPPMYRPAMGAGAGAGAGGGGGSGGAGAAPVSLPGNGRYPGPQAAQGGAAPDPIMQAMALPPQQRAAMSPEQKAQIVAQLRARQEAAMASRQAQASQVPGNAVRP